MGTSAVHRESVESEQMRAVNKGDSPYESIKEYQDAIPFQEKRIGLYCSYCEMSIKHVPEVEHKVSKSLGGELTVWENLLLGCKYCNTRKKDKVAPQDKDLYLWPDEDNTAIAYVYEYGYPKVNKECLQELDPTGNLYKKADNTYKVVGLGNDPTKKIGEKDRRFLSRNSTYYKAQTSLKSWKNVREASFLLKEDMKRQILMTATAEGFFSVWLTVFSGEPEICNALIESFPGTRKECYDELGRPKKIVLEHKKDEIGL